MSEDNNLSIEEAQESGSQVPVDLSGVPEQIETHDSGQERRIGPDGLFVEPEPICDEEEEKKDAPLRVKRFATIMNIVNTLLGAGILGVPHALTYCGIIPSVIMLSVVAFLSFVGTVMTMRLTDRKNVTTLSELALVIMGRIGKGGMSACSLLFCYGCMVAYLIIGRDTIISWFDAGGVEISGNVLKGVVVFIYSMVIPVPLTFFRDIGFLAPLSTICFGAVLFFILAMIIKVGIFVNSDDIKPDLEIGKMDMGIFSAISIFSLAFTLPVVILPIVQPYNPDKRKRTIVAGVGMFLCWLCVATPGLIGYCMFGDKTEGIILDNFGSKDVLIIFVRIGFFVVVSFSYPCVGQSVLAEWAEVIYDCHDQGGMPAKKRAIVVLVTNAVAIVVAIFLPNATPALSIGGALGGCLVDFFFPSVMWIMISKKPKSHWQNVLCIIFAIFGVVCAGIATYQAILDAIDAYK